MRTHCTPVNFAKPIWALHDSGYSGIRIRDRYAAEYKTPAIARSALLLRLLSPLIAACNTAGIYIKPLFWRHLHYLPIVYVTKIIYCFGAADSVESGFAFDNASSPTNGTDPAE